MCQYKYLMVEFNWYFIYYHHCKLLVYNFLLSGSIFMKSNIHPPMHKVLVQCVCSNEFSFNSALDSKVIHLEVCNKCHPFYTGKQQVIATTGRVDNFNSKFTNFQDKKKKTATIATIKSTSSKKVIKNKADKNIGDKPKAK